MRKITLTVSFFEALVVVEGFEITGTEGASFAVVEASSNAYGPLSRSELEAAICKELRFLTRQR